METYDENKDGVIETITAGKMLMDLYRAMNKDFHPTATDIASYARIFDRSKKGKITYEDLENLSLKYFWNENVPHPSNSELMAHLHISFSIVIQIMLVVEAGSAVR